MKKSCREAQVRKSPGHDSEKQAGLHPRVSRQQLGIIAHQPHEPVMILSRLCYNMLTNILQLHFGKTVFFPIFELRPDFSTCSVENHGNLLRNLLLQDLHQYLHSCVHGTDLKK